jgi:branched-chain amino acid transport system ATP-binding protein
MILLVEQNALKALEVGDRGYVLSLGRTVMEGSGKMLLEDAEVLRAYLGTKAIPQRV